jgi:hypothetical protein
MLTAVFATTCIVGSGAPADADDIEGAGVGVLTVKSNHSYGRSGGHHTPPSRADRDGGYGRHDGNRRPSGHGHPGHSGHDDHRGHDYGHRSHPGYPGHWAHPHWDHSHTRRYVPPYWGHYHPFAKHKGYYCEYCHYHSSSYSIFYQHVFQHHHVPWYEIGALIVFDPVRLYFVYGGHG